MSEIPEDIRRVAKGVLCDLADEREAATTEGRAFWSGEKAFEIIARALLAERERAKGTRDFEPGTLRVCPLRDAICPHGIFCEYSDGYTCKTGWNSRPSQPERATE